MNLAVQEPPLEEADVATIRVRTEVLEQRRKELGYRSMEEFVRKAGISRGAWEHMRDPNRKAIQLHLLATVMKTLDLSFDELLEYRPDEEAIGK